MDTIIQAMAEPNRLQILKMVRDRELSAGEIAKKFKGITRPAVSQHLTVLKKNGLIEERRDGTRRLYRVRPEGFEALKSFLEGFWDPRLRKLKQAAERHERKRRK